MNLSSLVHVPYAPTYGRRFMVSTTDQVASTIAANVLQRGGNAADAAVATAAALSVVAQHQCGMGGDAFVLVRHPDGTVHALDAAGRSGSGADPDRARREGLARLPLRMDVRTATVPGALDGWLELHKRFGTWDLADLLAPAIDLAANGFSASPTLVRDAAGVTDIQANEEFGTLTTAGQRVVRPAIASILRDVAQLGRDGFYGGTFGEGLLTLGPEEFSEDDLRTSDAAWVDPLQIEAFGHTLWTMPPTSQGYLVLAAARIAERIGVPPDANDPLWAHLLIEAARAAGANRERDLHEGAEGSALLAPNALAAEAGRIHPDRRRPFDEQVRDGDTNYFCIVDETGLTISFIHSNAHGFGSHLVVPGTGVFLHNRGIGFSLEPGHPAEYGPRRKPPHTLAPLIVTGHRGALRAALGTMGADSQPQVLLQLLHRLLVVGDDPATALAAGRWYLGGPGTEHEPFDTWLVPGGASVHVEAHAPDAWRIGLTQRGHDVQRADAFTVMAGYAQAIVAEDEYLVGASDPRALSGATLAR